MNKRIFLVGLPGAGKTTMGLSLAHHLGTLFVDLDQEIEKAEKQSIGEIFEDRGESYFRRLEQLHLQRIIAEHETFVLSSGGGTPCFFNNMDIMNAAGTTIFINTPTTEIQHRLKDDVSRPLMRLHTLEELLQKREKWYNQADHTIQKYEELLDLMD